MHKFYVVLPLTAASPCAIMSSTPYLGSTPPDDAKWWQTSYEHNLRIASINPKFGSRCAATLCLQHAEQIAPRRIHRCGHHHHVPHRATLSSGASVSRHVNISIPSLGYNIWPDLCNLSVTMSWTVKTPLAGSCDAHTCVQSIHAGQNHLAWPETLPLHSSACVLACSTRTVTNTGP
jgi:hypothetical protein